MEGLAPRNKLEQKRHHDGLPLPLATVLILSPPVGTVLIVSPPVGTVLKVSPPPRGIPLGGRPLGGRLLVRPRPETEKDVAPGGSGVGFKVAVPLCGAMGAGRSSAPVATLKLMRPPPMVPPSEPPAVDPQEGAASAAGAASPPLPLPPAPRLGRGLWFALPGLGLGLAAARAGAPAGAKKQEGGKAGLLCASAGVAVGESRLGEAAIGISVPPPPRAPNCRKRCGLGRASSAQCPPSAGGTPKETSAPSAALPSGPGVIGLAPEPGVGVADRLPLPRDAERCFARLCAAERLTILLMFFSASTPPLTPPLPCLTKGDALRLTELATTAAWSAVPSEFIRIVSLVGTGVRRAVEPSGEAVMPRREPGREPCPCLRDVTGLGARRVPALAERGGGVWTSGGDDLDVWCTRGDGALPLAGRTGVSLPSGPGCPPTGLSRFFLSGEEISNRGIARDCDVAEPLAHAGDARCRLRSGVHPGSSMSASSMSSHSCKFSSSMSPRSSSSALRSIRSDSNSSSMPFHSSAVVTQPTADILGGFRDERYRHDLRARFVGDSRVRPPRVGGGS